MQNKIYKLCDVRNIIPLKFMDFICENYENGNFKNYIDDLALYTQDKKIPLDYRCYLLNVSIRQACIMGELNCQVTVDMINSFIDIMMKLYITASNNEMDNTSLKFDVINLCALIYSKYTHQSPDTYLKINIEYLYTNEYFKELFNESIKQRNYHVFTCILKYENLFDEIVDYVTLTLDESDVYRNMRNTVAFESMFRQASNLGKIYNDSIQNFEIKYNKLVNKYKLLYANTKNISSLDHFRAEYR